MGLLITNQEVVDLMGDDAVRNLTDDGNSESNFITAAVKDAEAWLLGKLVFRYTAATLARSPQVKMVVKYYAAYLLTTRRGGVFYYGEALEDMKQYVEELRERRAELSDENGNQLTQDASTHLPISVHNQVVDERFPGDRIRTIDKSSKRTISDDSFNNDGVSFFGQ